MRALVRTVIIFSPLRSSEPSNRHAVCISRSFNSTTVPSSTFSTSFTSTARKNLVVLGTGWASYSFLKNIKKNRHLKNLFNVIVISPRNHFLFTPLLASTTVGTLEFRSIIEPVRNAGFRDEHHFHLSNAVELDVEEKVLKCASVLKPDLVYDVPYDLLVIGVGAMPNDFNIPGVKEYTFFLKVGSTYPLMMIYRSSHLCLP